MKHSIRNDCSVRAIRGINFSRRSTFSDYDSHKISMGLPHNKNHMESDIGATRGHSESSIQINMETKESESIELESAFHQEQGHNHIHMVRRSSLSASSFEENNETETLRFDLNCDFSKAVAERTAKLLAKKRAIRDSAVGICIAFFLYFVIGVLFYSVWEGDWEVKESILFIMYTATTVGYGNHTIPNTRTAKIFTTFYIIVGIGITTLVASVILEYVVLKGNQARHSRDCAHIVRQGLRQSQNSAFHGQTVHVYMENQFEKMRCLDFCILIWKRTKDFLKHTMIGRFIYETLSLFIIIGIGAIVLGINEGWSAIDSIYFAVVTMTTVGYGDIHATKTASIWITIFWLPFSIFFMSVFLSNVAQKYRKLYLGHVFKLRDKLGKEFDSKQPECDFGCDIEILRSSQTMKRYVNRVKEKMADVIAAGSNQDGGVVTGGMSRREAFRAHSPASLLFVSRKMLIQDIESNTSDEVPSTDELDIGRLRTLVLERLALIIQHELLCEEQYDVFSKDRARHDDVTIRFPDMKEVALKWFIPRRARESFAIATVNVLMTLGTRGVRSGALFELPPVDFHRLFIPLIATMEPPIIMETWLASTEAIMANEGWNSKETIEEDVSTSGETK